MQQQQHMAGGMGGVRPPPPEYKAAQAQMMHAGISMGQQARFPNTGPMRRVTQQPMPPSGEYTSTIDVFIQYDCLFWIISCTREFAREIGIVIQYN